MTYKRSRQSIGVFPRTTRGHVRRFDVQRLHYSEVTDFTPINDVVGVNAYLMAENRVVEVRGLCFQTFNSRRSKTDQMVFKIVVFLLSQLSWQLQLVRFITKQRCFSIA